MDSRIDAFIEKKLSEDGISKASATIYARDLELLEKFFATRDIDMADLNRKHVADFLGSMQKRGLSALTLVRILSVIRQFSFFLYYERFAKEDVSAGLFRFRKPSPTPHVLSKQQIEAIIQAASKIPGRRGKLTKLGLELLYGAGLRISELLELPTAVMRHKDFLSVRGKGSKYRLVPCSPKWWLNSSVGGPNYHLFPGKRRSRCLSRQAFSRWLKVAAVIAEVDPARVSPHVFRHSIATHLLDGGADLKVIQAFLGHVSLMTTQIYTNISGNQTRRALSLCHPLSDEVQAIRHITQLHE